MVGTFSAVAVPACGSQQEALCRWCAVKAGNAREGMQGNATWRARQAEFLCEICWIFFGTLRISDEVPCYVNINIVCKCLQQGSRKQDIGQYNQQMHTFTCTAAANVQEYWFIFFYLDRLTCWFLWGFRQGVLYKFSSRSQEWMLQTFVFSHTTAPEHFRAL